jgi:hypothetical protein
MDNCCLLLYTHSEYDDILEICLKRIKKYFSGIDLRVCINDTKLITDKYSEYNISHTYQYNSEYTYHAKLASALKLIDTKYVLLHHDNNIFYDTVNIDTINSIIRRMSDYNMDFVRLSSSGIYNPVISDTLLLSQITGPYYFSVFPCIWKKDILLKLCIDLDKVYRESEDAESQEYASKLKGYYVSNHLKDTHRVISHFYPSVHPLGYGKWEYKIYPQLIFDIAYEYNIDLTQRGSTPD